MARREEKFWDGTDAEAGKSDITTVQGLKGAYVSQEPLSDFSALYFTEQQHQSLEAVSFISQPLSSR